MSNISSDPVTGQALADEEVSSGTEESKYREGETLTFVKVRFPGHTKSLAFLVGKRKFKYGQQVVAMSDRGMAVGHINSFPYQKPFTKDMLPLRYIARTATPEDVANEKDYHRRAKNAEETCLKYIEKYQLPMNLTHVELTQFGKKAVFYFSAPSRVDFRNLVKELVQDIKMRIELRQISVRDRSAAIGGIGPCGRQLCCSSFLQKYGGPTMKMAKNQNLSLIPSKLNGVCGQLKCCLKYEDEVYSHKRSKLPEEGSFIQTANGDFGKVTKLHILLEQFEMLTSQGQIRRYVREQYLGAGKEDLSLREKFPERLEHVINETSNLVGPPAARAPAIQNNT